MLLPKPSIVALLLVGGLALSSPATAASLGWYGKTIEGKPCAGTTRWGYGPYDYSDPVQRDKYFPIVRAHHFYEEIASWDSSQPVTRTIVGNVQYTLMSFPNHYPALQVLVKLYLAKKSALPLPPECWFYRAIVFRPKDATTYQAFGVYMQRRGRLKDAVNLYKQSLALHPNNPEVHYDLGLALAKLGRYAEARSQAQLAYAGGYPLPGLRNILKRAGHWSDSPKGSGLQHKSH